MYKVTVFPGVKNNKWYLYQYVLKPGVGPKKIILAENINDQETARFMADTLTKELLGPMVPVLE